MNSKINSLEKVVLREGTKEHMERVCKFLTEHEYCTSSFLAKKCQISKPSVYRVIRLLRMDGIGIIPTSRGYVLSKYASKNDDVGFMRRLNGRRTSDYIALNAAEKHIKRRWKSVSDRRSVNLIMRPLSSDLGILKKGASILLKSSK